MAGMFKAAEATLVNFAFATDRTKPGEVLCLQGRDALQLLFAELWVALEDEQPLDEDFHQVQVASDQADTRDEIRRDEHNWEGQPDVSLSTEETSLQARRHRGATLGRQHGWCM